MMTRPSSTSASTAAKTSFSTMTDTAEAAGCSWLTLTPTLAITYGSNLQGICVLYVVGVLTLVPCTLVHPSYCFSVGYGAAIATMALAMILSFGITLPKTSSELLVYACFLYGIRLSAFLLIRTRRVKNMRDQVKQTERFSRFMSLSLAVMLSILYAFMVSPSLFALRDDSKPLQWIGVLFAYVGFALETIADQQKYETKRLHNMSYGDKGFVGPTDFTYSICRHPNFLGEIIFWTGIFLGGMASFSNSLVPWICGMLGWATIVNIMVGSATRLDEKQLKTYGGQKEFDEWRMEVKASLIPFIL